MTMTKLMVTVAEELLLAIVLFELVNPFVQLKMKYSFNTLKGLKLLWVRFAQIIKFRVLFLLLPSLQQK